MTMTNQHCSFNDSQTQSRGEVYIGSGKMRGDFMTPAGGEATTSHVVSDGDNIYIWTDGSEAGVKTSLTDIEELDSDSESIQSQSVDLDREVDYTCSSWSVDDTMFDLPDIAFQDLGELLPASPDTQTPGPLGCDACNSLPAESAAACREALECE
jgi:hypothetical protein